jgi:hypothetical protein
MGTVSSCKLLLVVKDFTSHSLTARLEIDFLTRLGIVWLCLLMYGLQLIYSVIKNSMSRC